MKKFLVISFIVNFTVMFIGLGAVTIEQGGWWVVLPVCACFYAWVKTAWLLVDTYSGEPLNDK